MSRLLLVLPVPFRRVGTDLFFESQACNGLERWAQNFDQIDLACPVWPDSTQSPLACTMLWQDVKELSCYDSVNFIELPWAFQLPHFIQSYPQIRQILREKIQANRYLSFGIGALVGDWAAIACLEAMRLHRPYSIWTDRVEHEVIRRTNQANSFKRRLKNRLMTIPLMQRYHNFLISNASLGLFHGQDCYEAYAPHCPNPYLVHDIHLKPDDLIPAEQLGRKMTRIRSGAPLRLIYAGRMVEMKGTLDWIQTMIQLRQQGIQFQATWLGDGPLLEEAHRLIDQHWLGDCVTLTGFVADRQQVLNQIRDADLFVFCHKTPESPRCLIEALMSGCALVGYDSPYPQDLAGDQAAYLTPQHDIAALSNAIRLLDLNRERTASLVEAAAEIGSRYSDEAVFRQRSQLIKSHL